MAPNTWKETISCFILHSTYQLNKLEGRLVNRPVVGFGESDCRASEMSMLLARIEKYEEEYTGQAPSCYDVFMFTHTKDHDGKTFQVDKAKEVHDLFVSRCADLELLGEEVDESELFYTAVGGHDRKRRIYGLGSYGKSIFPGNSSQTCTSPDTSSEKNHLETKIQKLEETIEQQRMDLNDMRNMVNDMRSTNNHIFY